MNVVTELLKNNERWARDMRESDPTFFDQLASQQHPPYMWIGCADSRVPANQIVGVLPGQMFVHRNVGNLVIPSDLNCLSAIQFAVDVLAVEHIIVCGHYGCGGVLASLREQKLGLIDNWLHHIRDVRRKYSAQLDALDTEEQRHDLLCELNVVAQVENVAQSTVVQDAWTRGQSLAVHGWIYGLKDGLIRDLHVSRTTSEGQPA